MFAALRRLLALALVLAPLAAFAFPDWQPPTPAELNMKSYAPDPDAPAVYLYREEIVDDALHMHSTYARIKILTEKGKETYSDVELPYTSGFTIDSIAGRTIHSDGTIVPFTGQPHDKLLVKEGNVKIMEKVFSMPDVQVGSIVEYRYKLRYSDGELSSPQWFIQQKIPVLKAHYHFMPTPDRGGNLRYVVANVYGHQMVANQLLYTQLLPPGAKMTEQLNQGYDLTVENIPALPHGDFLPPFGSLTYRVVFYYSPFRTAAEYWKTNGNYWSKDFDHFAHLYDKLRNAVNGLFAPGDTDEQKVQKIYAAVMKIDDTDFTRQHSAQENKAEGVKIKSAEDVWAQQRGTGDEITRLFVAMVRAAGLKAYGAKVENRDDALFVPNYLNWEQLDDELAIVSIGGKEVYFDPGQRYCEYAKLNWKHTWAGGIRQTDGGTELFSTPGPVYTDNATSRAAELTLAANGQVQGLLYISMSGAEALRWRQAALNSDDTALKRQYQDQLQHSMPPGVQVKTNHFIGLTDYTHPLMVVLNVSGTLGTTTGHHVFLPSVFFEAGNPPLFAETHREYPVDMHYPYMVKDEFHISLPPNITVESLPKGGDIPFAPNADYLVKYGSGPGEFAYGRLLRVANIVYKAAEYPQLRDFFQKISASDQAQVAMKMVPAAVTTSAPAATPATGVGK